MASSSSSGLFSPEPPLLTQAMKDGECRSWAELPSELTSSILSRLSSIDILENAQKVCTSWRRVCKDTAMWRKIDMRNSGDLGSSNLRSLKLVKCSPLTCEGLTEAIVKLPLLEELQVSYCSLSVESLKVVGQSLPNLKTLKLNRIYRRFPCRPYVSDDDALAIAETMPRLSHLQLFANKLTNAGLNAILDHCPNLEHLDLRLCHSVRLLGDLKKRCSERIKVFRRPFDSFHDYPHHEAVIYTDSSDDHDNDYYEDDDDSYDNDDVYGSF
ncbi:hypothetical protein F2Q70_00000178 [Brassica cretica]|uniref:F-box domain-containing protein n=1 Tax=Brassica cretica TaxID=69181 RepID=A0A8S9J1X1_BRACR|nr:hypothetical protein F2Q70_00000178 [Brassica cretica]